MIDMKKVDLHLHLDGSLSCSLVEMLAEEAKYDFPGKTMEQLLMAPADCSNLVEYLCCFDLPIKLLQAERALTLAAYDVIKRLETDKLEYAEIRFAPQLHTKDGLSQHRAVEAVGLPFQKNVWSCFAGKKSLSNAALPVICKQRR